MRILNIYILVFALVSVLPGANDNIHSYPQEPVKHGAFGYLISARFAKLMLGVDDQLYAGDLSCFTRNFGFGSFGLSLEYEGDRIVSTQRANMYYLSPDLWLGSLKSKLWVGPGVARIGYNTSNFHDFDFLDPVFQAASSKVSPFCDAGIYTYYGDFGISAWAENILQPNLSILEQSGEAEPLSIDGLFRVDIGKGFVPWAGATYSGLTERILPSLGISWEYRGWNFALGYLKDNIRFNMIAPIVCERAWVKYDAAYHTTSRDVASAVITSHRIGIDFIIPPPKRKAKPKPNFILEPGELPDIWAQDTAYVSVAVINDSEVKSDSTNISLFTLSFDDTIPVGVMRVPELKSDEEFIAQFIWIPPHPGSFEFIFTVDDSGSNFPGILGKIEEAYEDDNRYIHEIIVFGDLTVSITPLLQVLAIPTLTYIREDEPIIPVVFFDSLSAEVPNRFDSTLAVIAERLQLNPDVVIELKSFIDEESDSNNSSLVLSRAESMRDKLVRFGVPFSSVGIRDTSEYDYRKPRIPITSETISSDEKKMIQDENRRVEMIAHFADIPYLVYEFELGAGSVEIPDMHKSIIDTITERMAGVLCSDHSAIILLEGYYAHKQDPIEVLSVLDVVRDYLRPRLQIFCPLDRIPIALGDIESRKIRIKIWLSAEKIIFKPIEQAEAAKEFKIPQDFHSNLIRIAINRPENVRKYDVSILNEESDVTIKKLVKGDGPPPSQVVWDWRDDNGNLIDPRGRYRIVLIVTDQIGQVYRVLSEPIWVTVEEWEHRLESSMVVQFSFDEATSESRYLESRLEVFARSIIEKAQIPDNSLVVRLTGHTDIIGKSSYNLNLSRLRAEKELRILRYLFRFILGFATEHELDQWLVVNKVKLEAVGERDNNPYTIERYRNGVFEKHVLGDNSLPEGRSINRRVVIEIEEMIKK